MCHSQHCHQDYHPYQAYHKSAAVAKQGIKRKKRIMTSPNIKHSTVSARDYSRSVNKKAALAKVL